MSGFSSVEDVLSRHVAVLALVLSDAPQMLRILTGADQTRKSAQ